MAAKLVWINGPFGVGKTQTAYELHRRLPDSHVADPEHLGFGIHRMLPPEKRTDFQDFSVWRQGVLDILDFLLRGCQESDQVIIVPMTIVNPVYFDEIIGKLRTNGHAIHHFTLLAREDTIRRRLRARITPLVHGDSWALKQIDRCLEALRRPEFQVHIDTNRSTVSQVAEEVAHVAGLNLPPDIDGRLRGVLRRTLISIKHIRFD